MPYNNKIISRFNKLILNPRDNYKKIIPYIKSIYTRKKRLFLEILGNENLSKPYPGHNKLSSYINTEKGFFIVCGGNDGYFVDPTYYLEKIKKWKGIIVEPTNIASLCKINRPNSKIYQYAVVSPDYKEKIIKMIDVNAMSVIKDSISNEYDWVSIGEKTQNIKAENILVPAKTIQSIIDEYQKEKPIKKIDLFVADIEGYEINAIKGLDFNKNSPTYMLIESHTEKQKEEIHSFLKTKNYELIGEIGPKDYLYRIIIKK